MRPLVVSRQLGHSSITITLDRYGHLYEGHDDELVLGLDETFRSAAHGGASVTPIR